jgi:hypothetical protein
MATGMSEGSGTITSLPTALEGQALPYPLDGQVIPGNEQDVIVHWVGSWCRQGRQVAWEKSILHVGQEAKHSSEQHPALLTSADDIERALSPLAHQARIRLMQAMYDGSKASSVLSEATGLKGGNLYYHLRELLRAGYVVERGGSYDITPLGCQMLVMVAVLVEGAVSQS